MPATCYPSLPDSRSPIVLFARLELAVESGDHATAAETQRELARLGITVRYVHHLLEPTGRTFSEHVLDRRLARAIELLRDTGHWQHKIADIAFEVGFKDLSYFNRVFRRKYGGTPTDVRQAAMSEHDRRYGSATDE